MGYHLNARYGAAGNAPGRGFYACFSRLMKLPTRRRPAGSFFRRAAIPSCRPLHRWPRKAAPAPVRTGQALYGALFETLGERAYLATLFSALAAALISLYARGALKRLEQEGTVARAA